MNKTVLILLSLLLINSVNAQWIKKSDLNCYKTIATDNQTAFSLITALGKYKSRILKTTNSGESWLTFIETDSLDSIYDFDILTDSMVYISYEHMNSGMSLYVIYNDSLNPTPIFNSDMSFNFKAISDSILLVVNSSGEIYMSTNSGSRWVQKDGFKGFIPKRNIEGIIPKIYSNEEQNIIIYYPFYFLDNSLNSSIENLVIMSRDLGETWEKCPSLKSVFNLKSINMVRNEELVAISEGNYILKSSGCTEEINEVYFNDINLITDLDLGKDPDVYYVACTLSTKAIFRSYDAGESWIRDSTNTKYGFRDIEYCEGKVWASGGDGIFLFEEGNIDEDTLILGNSPDVDTISTSVVLGTILIDSQTLYPNPAEDYIEITGLRNGLPIHIYDLSGRLIETSQTSKINLTKYNSGTYLVLSSNGKIRHKFVKR